MTRAKKFSRYLSATGNRTLSNEDENSESDDDEEMEDEGDVDFEPTTITDMFKSSLELRH